METEKIKDFSQNQIYTLGYLLVAASETGEDIEMIGYNNRSGNVYVALDNGVVLFEFEGRKNIYYMVTNFETGEELEYYDYAEAKEMSEVLSSYYETQNDVK